MENGPIKVMPISIEHAKTGVPDPNWGARTPEQLTTQRMAGKLLSGLAQQATGAYRLEWEGDKVPDGAVVGGHTIQWTQNGQVIAGGKMVGTYERTIEFGGDTGKKQEMLVYLF